MLDDNTWNKLQVNRMFVTQGEFIGCGGGGGGWILEIPPIQLNNLFQN